MYPKLKLHYKYIYIISIIIVFFLRVGSVYASSEPLVVCPSAGSNPFSFPNHMATSCNTNPSSFSYNIPLKVVSVNHSKGTETLKATQSLAFDVQLQNFGLLNYFDSINSNGTAYNNGQGNPYTPYGYLVEKLGMDPYVNFSELGNTNVLGLGGYNVNLINSTVNSNSMTENISVSTLNPSSGVAFFPVPYLGNAADLFTLGSTYILDNQYNPLQLPNSSVVSSSPLNQFGTVNQNNINSDCATFTSNNNGNFTCKLIDPYGDPYNPTKTSSDTIGGYYRSNSNLLSGISNFLGGIYNSVLNFFGSGPTPPITNLPQGYCPLSSQQNTTDTNSVTNSSYMSSPFTINVNESCKIVNCQSSYTYSISPNLYLQGLNRILADEWYMEASLDDGQPIGHTNINAWQDYVNPQTSSLYPGVLSALQNNTSYTVTQGPNIGQVQTATEIQSNLFSGIGINVSLNVSLQPASSVACLTSTGSGTNSQTVSYEFPWLGNVPIIEQNLDIHKFQPYFSNNTTNTNSNSGVSSPLPEGEYYITDRSQFPDPLLLYLVYVGALSTNDPIVSADLGSYNPFACTQSTPVKYILTSSNTNTSVSATGIYQNPLRSVSNLSPERIDQGVDYSGTGPVYALGPGRITYVNAPNGSGWGPNNIFIEEQLTSGPAAGLYSYVAECINPTVTVGETVTTNTVIGNMINCGYGIETGWANGISDIAAGASQFNGTVGNSTAYGINYSELLASLGAPPGKVQGTNISPGTIPSNWPVWN